MGKIDPSQDFTQKTLSSYRSCSQGVALKHPLKMGSVVGWDDIMFDPNDDTILVRQSMEKHFSEK